MPPVPVVPVLFPASLFPPPNNPAIFPNIPFAFLPKSFKPFFILSAKVITLGRLGWVSLCSGAFGSSITSGPFVTGGTVVSFTFEAVSSTKTSSAFSFELFKLKLIIW